MDIARKKSVSRTDAKGDLQQTPKVAKTAKTEITLDKLPIGSRLIVRSKKDWRFAAVSKIVDERIVLTVCSPSGYTYRLRREFDTVIAMQNNVPVLIGDETENWQDNFCRYDLRW